MKQNKGTTLIKEVMLVDDEPIDLFICEKILTSLNFADRYTPIADSVRALDIITKRLESDQALPEIVFLDYFMPSIDGQDFLARMDALSESYSSAFLDIKFIVLTSLKAPQKRKTLSSMQRVYKVMGKPLNERSVLELGEELFQEATH